MENKPTPDEAINAKIDAIDDPVVEEENKDAEPTEDSPEEGSEETEEEGEDKDADESEDSGDEADKAGEDEDGGYSIDEGDEDESEEPTPPAQEGINRSQLTTEQQYILDNLKPVTVRGEVDGKTQTFDVYDPSQLPVGFNYLDQRDMSVANKAFAMLETQAEKLQNDFRAQDSQKAATEFKKREDTADREDIGRLQREGDIPKFKAEPNSKEFDSDPATVLIQEVLDYKEATNAKYLEEYNAGRPYKHIGFEEAFKMYQRENPTKGNADQIKEDNERKGIAKRAAKGKGSENNSEPNRPRVHSNMGSRDLDALIEAKTAGW